MTVGSTDSSSLWKEGEGSTTRTTTTKSTKGGYGTPKRTRESRRTDSTTSTGEESLPEQTSATLLAARGSEGTSCWRGGGVVLLSSGRPMSCASCGQTFSDASVPHYCDLVRQAVEEQAPRESPTKTQQLTTPPKVVWCWRLLFVSLCSSRWLLVRSLDKLKEKGRHRKKELESQAEAEEAIALQALAARFPSQRLALLILL